MLFKNPAPFTPLNNPFKGPKPPYPAPAASNATLPIGDFAIFLTPLTAFFNPFAKPPSKNASLFKLAIPPPAKSTAYPRGN